MLDHHHGRPSDDNQSERVAEQWELAKIDSMKKAEEVIE